MPTLENPKHEKMAQELAINNNKTQVMLNNNKGIKYDSARCNANAFMSKNNIDVRADELRSQTMSELQAHANTTIKGLVKTLSKSLKSTKPVVVDKVMHTVVDNGTRLEACKFGFKLYGVGQEIKGDQVINNTQNNINLVDPSLLGKALDRVEALKADYVNGKLADEDLEAPD